MKTIASILVNGVKQRIYFNNTVYLECDTEFEIEFFNKSQRTVCPSLIINGERLSSSPVIYNGQRFVLKDFISDNRKFLFKVYEVDSNDEEVKEAIKDNGIISITYYYEKQIEKKIIEPTQQEFSTENDSDLSLPDPPAPIPEDDEHYMFDDLPDNSGSSDFKPSKKGLKVKEETGKIMKGSASGVSYKSVEIDLDYTDIETQVIKLLPHSKKPDFVNCPRCQYESRIEANYCEECGYNY